MLTSEPVLAKWDRRFAGWFTPVVTNMLPPTAADYVRKRVRELTSQRRCMIRMLRRTERSFLAVLGAEETGYWFPYGFDLPASYRYICALRDRIRGLFAVGEVRRGVVLSDRLISILVEDSFALTEAVPVGAPLRDLVDTFADNVRMLEDALRALKVRAGLV